VETTVSAGRVHPRLLIVWALLLGLVGVIVIVGRTDLVRPRPAGPGRPDSGQLLPVPVGQLGAIEVIDAGALHRFERDADGGWFYHGVHDASAAAHRHSADPATAERIERAFQAFGRARIERRVGLDRDPAAYGLSTPKVVILVYPPNAMQPLAQYAVGDVAPDTVSRYVNVVGATVGVVTIPGYQIDNLLSLIDSVAGAPATR
jgi:Domain of unknown function (DUF4340)